MFIVFEGLDGVGKTTQAKMLVDYLNSIGKEAIYTNEPAGGGEFSLGIRKLLLSTKTTLLTQLLAIYSARNEHILNTIIPALNEGKIVVCDRFFYSSVAYFCKEDYSEENQRIVEYFQSLMPKIEPDLCILCDISVEESEKRINARKKKDDYDNFKREEKIAIRDIFLDLHKKQTYKSIILDCSSKVQDSHKNLIRDLKNFEII